MKMNGNIWHIWLSARNLGVIIDSQLSLDAHVAAVCRSGYYQLRQLRLVTGLYQLMLPRHWCRHLYPVDWIIATHCCMACVKG